MQRYECAYVHVSVLDLHLYLQLFSVNVDMIMSSYSQYERPKLKLANP